MNRKRQQSELMFSLGQFFGPVLRVAENPNAFDADEKARILARFFNDHDAFNQLLVTFCHSGEPGHKYAIQLSQAQYQIGLIQQYSAYNNISEPDLLNLINDVAQKVVDTLLSIPMPVDSAIHEAKTPFSTYCLIKDLCSTAHAVITWLDRYFDQTVFHRFFVDTPRSSQITLVTLHPTSAKGKADAKRIEDFMDISRLFAQERGVAGYRLVVSSQFHDRWLQCDNKLFTLGGSIKDLNTPFTISRLDSTPENQKFFDDAVMNGTELFGPNQPNHP
jgi:hypothetical protein